MPRLIGMARAERDQQRHERARRQRALRVGFLMALERVQAIALEQLVLRRQIEQRTRGDGDDQTVGGCRDAGPGTRDPGSAISAIPRSI